MTTTMSHTADEAAAVVSDYFRHPIGALEALAGPLCAALAEARRHAPLTTSRLDALIEPIASHLGNLPLPIYGAGFITSLDLLRDARGHLAWWQGADWRKLVLAAQTTGKQRIDYRELEWYRVPVATGSSHVAGPYVDYLCSDEYTMTVATPVIIDGEFAGVLALDLLIDEVERQLMPTLDTLGIDITLINGVGRVVISTDPARVTGDSLRGDDTAGYERVSCSGVALDVLVTPRS